VDVDGRFGLGSGQAERLLRNVMLRAGFLHDVYPRVQHVQPRVQLVWPPTEVLQQLRRIDRVRHFRVRLPLERHYRPASGDSPDDSADDTPEGPLACPHAGAHDLAAARLARRSAGEI
jgi:hypothetical protein